MSERTIEQAQVGDRLMVRFQDGDQRTQNYHGRDPSGRYVLLGEVSTRGWLAYRVLDLEEERITRAIPVTQISATDRRREQQVMAEILQMGLWHLHPVFEREAYLVKVIPISLVRPTF